MAVVILQNISRNVSMSGKSAIFYLTLPEYVDANPTKFTTAAVDGVDLVLVDS